MNILIFIFCFLVNMILILTILAGVSLLGQFGVLLIVDIAIWYLAYKAEIV